MEKSRADRCAYTIAEHHRCFVPGLLRSIVLLPVLLFAAGFSSACNSDNPKKDTEGTDTAPPEEYPIDSTVVKTTERMISFPYVPRSNASIPGMPKPADPALSPNGGAALNWNELRPVSNYDKLGYGEWEYLDQPLPKVTRTDIMPTGYDPLSAVPSTKLVNFVAMTDIHLTDKEAPNQLISIQKENPDDAGQNTSIYSGILPYTPHVFDAAIQTANALHKENPFDFFISLGDVSNSTMYNELRWYLDIVDGEIITPSSGAHLGADTVDYQKPFQAAGLDKSIPFYQTLGNHDHFMIGSFPVYESGLEETYISDSIWSVPLSLLSPNLEAFPALFDKKNLSDASQPQFYQGVIDGSSPDGDVIYDGPVENFSTPPTVAADPDRRSLRRAEWIAEFFKTTSNPKGHGFNLVASNPNFDRVPEAERAGFACYSFVPKSDVPLKIIVLDDTQREDDGSVDIHGHGFLDETRWAWLQAELDDGQAANQLMIIAAHIPIAVANIGTELEWWQGAEVDSTATMTNAVDLAGLVAKLQSTTNLLMWISGHRHLNHVKAFVSPVKNEPEQGFWQVETSSLHDFPQQFRTFEIFLNSDYSVSIEAVNVDPAFAEGTPAAKSRKNAIAAQQIVHGNLTSIPINYQALSENVALPSMDPTRKQGGIQTDTDTEGDLDFADPSIQFVDLSAEGIPYNASYNARLIKQLSPAMRAQMKALFPANGKDNESPSLRGHLVDVPVEISTQSIAQLDQVTTDTGLQVLTGPAKCDVKVVQINYQTVGVQPEEMTNASAALLIPGGTDPDCQGPLPLIAFARGTNLEKAHTNAMDLTDPTAMLLSTFFASQGYAVVATDYLGYALSAYPYHPYIHADSEASAVIDSIRAARNAAPSLGLTLNGKVMVSGYSQGGHASMATQRAIERDNADEFDLVVAAHLAGSYNVSEALIDGVTNPILGVQYFVPFQITAWQKVYGNLYADPNEIFNAPYAGFIEGLMPAVDYPADLAALPEKATAPADARDEIFKTEYLADLAANPNNAVIVAAKKQDLFGWNPLAPTELCGGSGDPTVKFSVNAQAVYDDFQSRGATNVSLVDVDPVIEALHGSTLTDDPTTYFANYHSAYESPLCAAEARKLFDQYK